MQLKIIENGQEIDLNNLNEEFIQQVGENNPFMGFILSMARLNKLSVEEMRTLLYKYFTKVIDLRDSSRKLEVQLMSLERDLNVRF